MKFVKLGLADPSNGGEPRFYRRIPLLENPHDCNFVFLKRHAVLLARGEETGDVRNVNLHEYAVQLCYMDEEGDKILLCSGMDVADAVFTHTIAATVKIVATVDSKPVTKSTQTAVPTTNEQGTEPTPPTSVVDALTDVLNCVVASANAGMAATTTLEPQRSVVPEDPPMCRHHLHMAVQKAARTSSEALKLALEQASSVERKVNKVAQSTERKVNKATHYAERKVNKAMEKASKQLSESERMIEKALAAITKAAAKEEPRLAPRNVGAEPVVAPVVAPVVEPVVAPVIHETTTTEQPLPFIHGRHTCDACLTTPIIGERYHATNMRDYDLCAKCHEQYKGSEITFEVAQLDRDAGLQQDRWRHKYARMTRLAEPHRARPVHHHCRRSPPVPPPAVPAPYVPASGQGFARPVAPSSVCASPPGQGFARPAAPSCYSEYAFFGSNVDRINEAALEQAIRRSMHEVGATSGSVEYHNSASAPVVAAATAPKEEEVYETEIHVEATSSPNVDNVVVVETCEEEALDDVVVEREISKHEEEAVIAKDETEAASLHEDIAVQVPVESVARMPKVVCSRAFEDANETATEAGGETIVSGKSVESAPSSPKAANSTFVEQDSGSTGYLLGETLDRMANAIDNLMIVDGADDDDVEEEEESHGSWSVVNEDENLARAAEMIGSALFHSDNNVGSQISSVSSVPTNVTNIVNQAQYSRWSYHLERLHELGFDDNAKNISVLEMLMAANIGVDSDEDVTLEQAVNALMSGMT